MFIDFLLERFRDYSNDCAIIWQKQTYDYCWLLEKVSAWENKLGQIGISPGSVVMVEADFSPNSIAAFLALTKRTCIFVPITDSVKEKKVEFIATAQIEWLITIDNMDEAHFEKLNKTAEHSLYAALRKNNQPGLVLFSSGSTGKSKAAVHNLAKLLEKFKLPRYKQTSISFLLYDHIGGVNTLLYSLANGGCIITLPERQPDFVLEMVEHYRVTLLPTSPSFINLMLVSKAYENYNITSLQTVTYGTEPMPESTLQQFHKLFPNIKLLQTYGLSELGILRSKSKDSSSLWMKVGGEGFETRIVDGILQIKAESAMLGYLNAPSPFTKDGWFHTGDYVEQDGDYIRVLGRGSEIINSGGLKVYPTEVESVLQELDEIAEAEVFGLKNPLLGQVVAAKIKLSQQANYTTINELKVKIRRHCSQSLESFKVKALKYRQRLFLTIQNNTVPVSKSDEH